MLPEASTIGGDQSVEQLRRELAEAREQQTATAEILREISKSPSDLRGIFQEIAATAARLCDAYDAGVMQCAGDHFKLVAHHGSMPAHRRLPLTRGTVMGRAVLDRTILHVTDLQAETEEFPEGSEIARRDGHRTILGVPLICDREAIGAIFIRRIEVRPFTDQAVIAIENTRLFEAEQASKRELQESLEQQTATGEILTSISASMADPQPVFDAIVRNASRLLGTQHCNVVLLRDGILHMPAAAGELLPRRFPRPLDHTTAVGQAILTKQVVQYSPVLGEGSVAPSATQSFAREIGYNSVLNVPMLHKDEVIGAARREAKVFDDKQVALMKAFADQAVIAIENARLFEEVQARTRELTQS